jgi:hypothetical protein
MWLLASISSSCYDGELSVAISGTAWAFPTPEDDAKVRRLRSSAAGGGLPTVPERAGAAACSGPIICRSAFSTFGVSGRQFAVGLASRTTGIHEAAEDVAAPRLAYCVTMSYASRQGFPVLCCICPVQDPPDS